VNHLLVGWMDPASDKVITLEEILTDPKLSRLFVDFVLKAHAEDNLEFWIEVELYKRLKDGSLLAKMGKRLYQTYLVAGADLEVNLEKKYKEDVRQKLDLEFWDVSLFEKAQKRIYHILSSDCVRMFVEKYPELKHTTPIKSKGAANSPRLTLLKHLETYQEFRRVESTDETSSRSSYCRCCPCFRVNQMAIRV